MNATTKRREPDWSLLVVKLAVKRKLSYKTLSAELGFSKHYLSDVARGRNKRMAWRSGEVLIEQAREHFCDDDRERCGVSAAG